MSYSQFNLIEASDFNNLVGGNPTATANTLNATWATGSGQAGYGQTAVANVSVGQSVAATSWASLVNNTASAASHQGSSITSVAAPVAGGVVTFLSAIPTNLQTIYTNRRNAAAQGSTTANTITTASTWTEVATWTHTATFANVDAARYFFNAGGQLKITCAHSNSTAGINALFNGLASNVGTLVFSGEGSANVAATIVGTSYLGFTKVGGGGNAPSPYVRTAGYNGLTTANTTVFTQTATGSPAGYVNSFITIIAKTDGAAGSNAGNGSVITIYTVWDEVPNGLTVGTGSQVTLTAVPPATTNIANTWGAITLAGSVSVT
jgi:hypothetical protein